MSWLASGRECGYPCVQGVEMWRIYLSVRAIALAASHAIPPKAQRLSVLDS
jgi:hypothetical protein